MKNVILPLMFSLKSNLLIILLMCSFIQINAQDKGKREEKVKQLKIGFFTEELNLSSLESEKFWPIYNEMEDKLKSLRKESKAQVVKLDFESDVLKDEDYKKSVHAMLDNDIEEATIKKEYFGKLATVIGYKKAAKTFKLEKDFKEKLLQELRDRPAGPPAHPRHR